MGEKICFVECFYVEEVRLYMNIICMQATDQGMRGIGERGVSRNIHVDSVSLFVLSSQCHVVWYCP